MVLCSLWAPSDGNVVERHLKEVRKKPGETPRVAEFSGALWSTIARISALSCALLFAGMLSYASLAFAAATPVGLGAAGTYSVLAGTMVTSTGATTISGDLGVSPGTAVVGFPPGIVTGAIRTGENAAQAQTDLLAAYNNAAARTPTGDFSGDNNGRTYTPGIYRTAAAFALTGAMTLDGQGDPNAVFIFQVNAALNTAADSNITLINGAQAPRIYWQVLGAAGTGASSTFSGTIMATGAITLGAGATLTGRALSRDTVTLAGNTITTLGGTLSISAPTEAGSLGSASPQPGGRVISGALGQVQVTDTRLAGEGSGWTASVTSTAFTTPMGAAIPASAVGYAAGPIIKTGIGDHTSNDPGALTVGTPVMTAAGINGDNSAAWNPLISVTIPDNAIAGIYSATITHSVL